MVNFCPECSGLLRRKNINGKVSLVCRCGYEEELENNNSTLNETVDQKMSALKKNLIILSEEDKILVHPVVKKECSKCGHLEAEAWQEQTRGADEPSTSFFRCTNCKFTWREY
ncbi:MAG: transcription factor S [Candidatus Lokiarchaeota archaeon]|nr:transcription factor S [Candidatus Lokiarchaeota archaeon]